MKRWGFGLRVMFVVLAPALAIALLLATYLAQVRFGDAKKSLADTGLVMARQLALASEYGVFSGNRAHLDSLMAAIAREPGVIGAAIHDSEGRLLAMRGRVTGAGAHSVAAGESMQAEAEDGQTLVSSAPVFQSPAALEDFHAGLPGHNATPATATARVLGRSVVVLTRANLIAQRNRLWLDSALIALAVLVGGVILAIRLSRQVTHPVEQLTTAVQRIAAGDFDARVEPYPGGAIPVLEDGVNAMARELKSARDDLERRIAEATSELAKKTAEAESTNEAKSRFLAAASHDLRQPLHALTLFADALSPEVPGARGKALLGNVGRSIDALGQLLGSLLDISKLDANIVKPNLTHFALSPVADSLQIEFAPQIQAKGLVWRAHMEGGLVAHSDRVLLETILRNLVSNAIRYTSAGSVELFCMRQGVELRIEVRDTGIGIPREQRREIFREFYQLANPERDRSKGLGLGLAIVDRLTSLLQHRIEVDSEPGQGSCFAIVLPAGDGAAVPAAEVPAPFLGQRDVEGMRVVVIDDELVVREGMQAILEGWGCVAILAGSEEEALQKLKDSAPPHAIIVDYRLRDGRTGAQAIECLCREFGNDIPALIVTGDTGPERIRDAQHSGHALLHKPVPPAKLRAYLRRVQRRRA